MWGRPSGPPPNFRENTDQQGGRHHHQQQQQPHNGGYGYPGQSQTTYNGQSTNNAYGGNTYGEPPSNYGQPPSNYGQPPSNYGQPPSNYGQPPSHYNEPSSSSYNAGNDYSRPPAQNYGSSSYGSDSYQRPNGPPPGWSQQQVQEQANSVSVFQENDHDINIQEAYNVHAPSQAPQRFSSQVDGYNYQYSNCTGRRKALLVGINYIGTKNQLRGCINDVHNVSKFLQKHGYKESDIVVLTDDQTNSRALPKKQNILDGMKWLVKGAQANDSLFFHYSGHGGQVEDKDGDEYDGYDECIYPMDFDSAGEIIDDIMHDILVKSLPAGCRLTALFDCCHSGSALDLPYTYSTKGIEKEPNVAAEAGQGLLSAVTSYMSGDTVSAITKAFGAVGTFMQGDNNSAIEKTKKTKTSPADVIMLSGCKDDQTSADASEGGQATGAMSYAFIKVMDTGKQQSYLSLLQNTRSVLSGKYSQKPQLCSSHPIDVNLQFIF
ncbi:Ca(2+)-dependent cysteine protease [Saccharomycopsis crataegensis]|uniref:Metacaspase-1 n=1 Tax=Saccharomycopsis crataegensis TaxID=43959 RepID=A0AAV5QJS0_9ASCO|nr:Ca(2+)-dependent cysteine protease [Saccharomycopsis crataegensis]